jgi:hypothetical protein
MTIGSFMSGVIWPTTCAGLSALADGAGDWAKAQMLRITANAAARKNTLFT